MLHKTQTHVKKPKPGAKILFQSTEIMKSYGAGSFARPPGRPREGVQQSQRFGAGLMEGRESRESFRKGIRLKLEGKKAEGLKDRACLGPPQCLTPLHTHTPHHQNTQGKLCTAQGGMDGQGTSRKRSASTHTVTVIGRRGGEPVPGQLPAP